jgi:hypothetical protein
MTTDSHAVTSSMPGLFDPSSPFKWDVRARLGEEPGGTLSLQGVREQGKPLTPTRWGFSRLF